MHDGMIVSHCSRKHRTLMVSLYSLVTRHEILGVHHDCRLKYNKHICLIYGTHPHRRAVLISKCFHTHEREKSGNLSDRC